MGTSLPLPQSPSGFAGMLFGKLMEWISSGAYREVINALEPKANERCLEIGFGTGRFAEMLLTTTPEVFIAGLDPTSTMVQTAKRRLDKRGFSNRFDFREGTDESIPWSDNHFDAVIAIHSFQFWEDPEHSIEEIDRVLRPSGRIVIAFRYHSSNPSDRLPNPISRSGQEIELAKKLLEKHGYIPIEHAPAGRSRIIRGDRKIKQ